MRRGILRKRNGDDAGASIEIAPLIDMVFLLLIFYIVSTSFIQDTAVSVTRPSSRMAGPVNERYLPVALTADGTLHAAGQAGPVGQSAHVATALAEAGVRTVVLRADARAPTEMLLRAMDTCRAAGADVVLIAATREGGS
jgi:biopolymer transport protein ExbD